MPKVPTLLRKEQVEANKTEVARLEHTLKQPHAQDHGNIHRQLRNLKKTLDELTPTQYNSDQIDSAVRRKAQLEEELVVGIPSMTELRRNPSGTRSKLIEWERKNKDKWLELKYINMRLEPENPEAGNVEYLRPLGSPNEISLTNAQIPGKIMSIPAGNVEPGAVASDTELEVLGDVDPELRSRFATLTGEQRSAILDAVRTHIETVTSEPVKRGPGRPRKIA